MREIAQSAIILLSKHGYRPSLSPGQIVRCKECSFIFVNPIESTKALIRDDPVIGDYPIDLLSSDDLSNIKGSWEEPIIESHLSEFASKQENARKYIELITQIVGRTGKILDVGCFCGVFLSVARELGWQCYGIEPLIMPSIYARGKYGLNIVTDTLHEDTFPADFFDVVTAFQVFEHLVEPAVEIRKIRRILKPGGLVVIEVPRIDAFLVRLLSKRHRHFVQDHVSFFSESTLRQLVRNAGFQVLRVFYPTRTMSFRHLSRWFEKYTKEVRFSKFISDELLNVRVRINLRDIICIVSIKK